MKQIESFLYYMRYELNYSVHTVLSYKKDLEQFAAFAADGDSEFAAAGVGTADVRAWVYDLSQRRGLAQNPVDDIPMAKLPKRLPEFVGEKKMDEILDSGFSHTDFEQVRNRLIVAMLYETGMRRAELVGLTDADIDTRRCELKVHGKRNKDRIKYGIIAMLIIPPDCKRRAGLRQAGLQRG